MEIGLTAKVKPEIDDREAENQASKLEEKFQDAVSDLPSTMNLEDVIEQANEMKETVEETNESMSSGAPPGAQASASQDTGSLPDTGQISRTQELKELAVQAKRGPEGKQKFNERERTLVEKVSVGVSEGVETLSAGPGGAKRFAQVGKKLDEISERTGRLGTLLLGGAALVGITGLALEYLSSTAERLANTSPLLGQVVDIFGLALELFFRPFASILGRFLLPLATAAIQLAAQFNRVFANEGIGDALSFLSREIIVGLTSAVLSVDVLGGLADVGQTALLGNDNNFGIADVFRIAILGAIGKVAIGRIFSKGILSMLPRITGARIISALTLPGVGNIIAKRMSSQILRASITEILEAGVRKLLQRAFGPAIANAPFGVLVQALKQTIISKIPSIGLKSILGRLVPSLGGRGLISAIVSKLPSISVTSLLGRILPSVGLKSILTKIGLGGIVRLFAGRLTYAIPVIGQLIGAIDLLTLLITALIPGMDAFSPVTYALTQAFNFAIDATQFLVDVLSGAPSAIMSFIGAIESFGGDVGNFISSLSISGVISGLNDILGSIMNFLIPILETFKLPLMLLAPFALLGIELFNKLNDVTFKDIVNFLKQLKDKITNMLVDGALNLANFISSGIGSLVNWVSSGIGSLVNWVSSGIGSLVNWVSSGIGSLADYIGSGIESLSNWIDEGIGELSEYVDEGIGDLSEYIDDGIGDLSEYVNDGLGDLSEYVDSGLGSLSNYVDSGLGSLSNYVGSGFGSLADYISSGFGSLADYVSSGFGSLSNYISSGFGSLTDYISSGFGSLADYVESGFGSIADYITGEINIQEYIEGAIDIANGFVDGSIQIQNKIEGAINIAEGYVDGAIDVANGFIEGSIDVANGFIEGAIDIAQGFIDGSIDIGQGFITGSVDIGESNLISGAIQAGEIIRGSVNVDFDDLITGSVDVASGLIDGSVDVASGLIDGSIDIANFVVGSIPFVGNGGGGGDQTFVPGMASGGVVTDTTLAVIGEGRESEAVLPLSRLSNMMSETAQPSPTQSVDISLESTSVSNEPNQTLTQSEVANALRRELGSKMDAIETSILDLASEIRRMSGDGKVEIKADGKTIAEITEDGKDKYRRTREVTR